MTCTIRGVCEYVSVCACVSFEHMFNVYIVNNLSDTMTERGSGIILLEFSYFDVDKRSQCVFAI